MKFPDATPVNLLDVWVWDELGSRKVGVLERKLENNLPYQAHVLFHYADDLRQSDAVSLLMPVRRETYRTPRAGLVDILHPIFDQNLPEGALRAYLEQRYRKVIPDIGDFDLLCLVGNNGIGRVRVVPYGTKAEHIEKTHPAPTALTELLAAQGSAKLLEALFETLAPISGVSGVQPKALFQSRSKETVPTLSPAKPSGKRRLTIQNEKYILKTSADDFPWLALNEYLCLQAAHLGGLNTVQAQLSNDGQTLAVLRFDISDSGYPLGFEDGCSLAGRSSREKYVGSYEDLLRYILDFLPEQEHQEAKRDFFQIVAFSCLIGNGDAHLKNFGLLYREPTQTPYLAPAFDLVCTTAYIPQDLLALSLLGQKQFPTIQSLMLFGCQVCNLGKPQTKRILEQILEGLELSLRDLNDYCEKFPEFAQHCGETMQGVWKRRLSLPECKLTPP